MAAFITAAAVYPLCVGAIVSYVRLRPFYPSELLTVPIMFYWGCVSVSCGALTYFTMIGDRMKKWEALQAQPTESTTTFESVTPTTSAEIIRHVPVNAVQTPMTRRAVPLADDVGKLFTFSGKRLDMLERQPLTRSGQVMNGNDYNAMIRALAYNEYVKKYGPGYQWTGLGVAWIEQAGLPLPQNDES